MKQDWSGFISRRKKLAIGTGAVLAVYAVLGFFIAPRILRPFLEKQINAVLNGKATVESLHINPFVFSVSVDNFKLEDTEQKALISFKELYINFQLRSLIEWAPTFATISLIEPRVIFRHERSGEFNFNKLLKSSETKPEPAEPKPVPRLIFDKIEVLAGNVTYFDSQSNKPFEFELSPFKIELLNFQSVPGKEARYIILAENEKNNSLVAQGTLDLAPLRVHGQLQLKVIEPGPLFNYLTGELDLKSPKAKIDIISDYEWNGGDASDLKFKTGRFEISDVEFALLDSPEPFVKIQNAALGVDFGLKDKHVGITDFTASTGGLNIVKQPDGRLNITNLSKTPPDSVELQTEPAPTAAQKVADENAWKIDIKNAKITKFSVNYRDAANESEEQFKIDDIALTLNRLVLAKSSELDARITAKLPEKGNLDMSFGGTVNPLDIKSDIVIDNLALKSIAHEVQANVASRMQDGTGSLKGKLQVQAGEPSPHTTFDGELTVANLKLSDSNPESEILGWDSLKLSGLGLSLGPNKLEIDSAVIKSPKVSLSIAKDGKLNLATLSGPTQSSPAVPAKEAPSQSFPYRIRNLIVENGDFRYRDDSLTPAFRTHLTQINGKVSGISEAKDRRLPLEVQSKVDEYGSLTYKGELVLGSSFPLQNGMMTVKDFNMATLTPYTQKYLGRQVEGGKLHAELKSTTTQTTINGENKLTLDRFYLTDQTGPSEVNLPIGTALAILRDGNGQINLDLPVRGDLKSPGLSYRKLFFQGLQSLIVEVVASPISVLASLYHFDREKLSHIDFAQQGYELTAAELEKLEIIRKAMADKPSLRLEIKGGVFPAADGDGKTPGMDESMVDLGNRRANAIRELIIQDDRISSERVYILAPEVVSPTPEGVIPTRLSLHS